MLKLFSGGVKNYEMGSWENILKAAGIRRGNTLKQRCFGGKNIYEKYNYREIISRILGAQMKFLKKIYAILEPKRDFS